MAYIRSGAFDWVAAEAAGIGSSTFRRWMKDGELGVPAGGFPEPFRTAALEGRAPAPPPLPADRLW